MRLFNDVRTDSFLSKFRIVQTWTGKQVIFKIVILNTLKYIIQLYLINSSNFNFFFLNYIVIIEY